jgi:hypothetical protein
MTQQALELLQKALTLPEEERTALVRSLIESLEEVADQGAERAWDEDIARAHRRARFRQSKNSVMGRSSAADFGKTRS